MLLYVHYLLIRNVQQDLRRHIYVVGKCNHGFNTFDGINTRKLYLHESCEDIRLF